jgi:predicted lipoprotein with Yx(FWY)xxD motif
MTTRARSGGAAISVALVFALAGCGGGGGAGSTAAAPAMHDPKPAAAPAATTPPSKPTGTIVTVGSTSYGRILLTGKKSLALYSFSSDTRSHSNCYGACAKAWPPLLTKHQPQARGAARDDLIGTTRRRGGALQVTYKGHPLYRYTGDTQPRQVLCQNVSEYGGLWTVVAPAGRPIH